MGLGFDQSLRLPSSMIQKQTFLNISDNTGIRWVKTFHLYGGSTVKSQVVGKISKGSAKLVKAPKIPYKGVKFKNYKKGHITKLLLVTPSYNLTNESLWYVRSKLLNAITLKKKTLPKSKYILGLTFYKLKQKKFTNLFKKIY